MEYKVESTELTDIADAIREKSGSEDALTFPNEFISGIRSIPTGSTSVIADEYDATSTYAVGDYVVYDNTLYKCNTAITTAEAWTSAHWDEVTVMEEVETKADTDGMYEDMSVGNLISTQFVENKEPYLFRRTGNGKNIDGSEKAFIDKLIGGTVAWNQKLPVLSADNFQTNKGTATYADGVATFTANEDGTSGIYPRTPVRFSIAGHIYFTSASVKVTSARTIRLGFATGVPVSANTETILYNIKIAPTNNASLPVYINNGVSGDVMIVKDYYCIDLTALFGSAEIADYIYSLEQTTAGAGVAWLRNHGFIDGSYRAFDSGSLQSVKTSEHRTSGKNLLPTFRSSAQNGVTFTVNSDGTVTANGTASANAQVAVTIPTNLTGDFYFTGCPSGGSAGTYDVYIWDVTKNARCKKWDGITNISSDFGGTHQQVKFVGHTAQFTLRVMAGQTVNNLVFKPMLVRSDVTDFTYEPYHINSYPLDPNLELRGLFKLDANNNLYAEGDVYESSGNVSRKYGIVDLGTLNWEYSGSIFYSSTAPYFGSGGNAKYLGDGVCVGYQNGVVATTNPIDLRWQVANSQAIPVLRISDSAYSDATAFKTMLQNNNVKLVYELATPTTETAQPYASPQVVNPLGTEEYVDTRDVPVPVGHETKYMANLREKIEDLPWDLSMIAPIENGTAASKAYSTGQYFLKDNQFCKALTSIASGATFTLNTNYAVTTVADELYTALHS